MYNKLWYNKLNKSKITPPSWVFSVIWPILYILMTISFYLVLKTKKCNKTCISIFLLQLCINLSWTYVFFKLKMTKLSLLLIISIFLLTLKSYSIFKKINNLSSLLLIPYLIWLCLAFYLNSYIVINN